MGKMTLAEHFRVVREALDDEIAVAKYYVENAEYKSHQVRAEEDLARAEKTLASLKAIAEAQPHDSIEIGRTFHCACIYGPEPCNCSRAEILKEME